MDRIGALFFGERKSRLVFIVGLCQSFIDPLIIFLSSGCGSNWEANLPARGVGSSRDWNDFINWTRIIHTVSGFYTIYSSLKSTKIVLNFRIIGTTVQFVAEERIRHRWYEFRLRFVHTIYIPFGICASLTG